uniref:Uncharacterized protein n=1 Tax=Romanomermis culicivorax TaxID=13658 RepID=A0A915K1R7_ROMCU
MKTISKVPKALRKQADITLTGYEKRTLPCEKSSTHISRAGSVGAVAITARRPPPTVRPVILGGSPDSSSPPPLQPSEP